MRVTREKALQNREAIVAAAARLFRERGFDGVGVDAVMKAAGLTHGGFYGHFKSKDDLAREALERAAETTFESQKAKPTLAAYVDGYLSEEHRQDVGEGCAMAALAGDVARGGEDLRAVMGDHVRDQIHLLSGLGGEGREAAIMGLCGLVGALTLSRAVDDPALAEEIAGVVGAFVKASGQSKTRRD
jgi:TetR/AcrR family transcriptional repressor of nem operon